MDQHRLREEWKDIKGYEDYQVSNKGDVRTFKRSKAKLGYFLQKRPSGCGHGHVFVKLGTKRLMVAKLVGEHFIDGWDSSKYIVHSDGDKTNNSIRNIRCTGMTKKSYDQVVGRYSNKDLDDEE